MTQNKKEQWLKEFKKEFPKPMPIIIDVGGDSDEIDLRERFEDLLSSLIDDINSDWKDRILEAVGKKKLLTQPITENDMKVFLITTGFNLCRSQILEKLELK